jgi:NAD(P)-dependent dehydrogenase (short-subunit alcohol dehydrogenase family)
MAKGKKVVEAVNEYLVKKGRLPTTSVVYNLVLDLDNLSDVMKIASRCEGLGLDRDDISVIINDAGVMAIPTRELTVVGNERTFQSNHLGQIVLTSALFPYLSRKGARVITVPVPSSSTCLVGPGGFLNFDILKMGRDCTARGRRTRPRSPRTYYSRVSCEGTWTNRISIG